MPTRPSRRDAERSRRAMPGGSGPQRLRFRLSQRTWDSLALRDPMWAVLSDPGKRGGLWDADEFFATGAQEVARNLAWVCTDGSSMQRLVRKSRRPWPGVADDSLPLSTMSPLSAGTGSSMSRPALPARHRPSIAAGRVRARILMSSHSDQRSMYERSSWAQVSKLAERRALTCQSPVIPGFIESRRRCQRS